MPLRTRVLSALAAVGVLASVATPAAAAASRDELARLLPAFDATGLGYGTVVDPADALRLAGVLRVDVGTVVDAIDVDRLLATVTARELAAYPVFASVGGITLRRPSSRVELIGYHQSNHEGARDLAPSGPTSWTTLDSRGRLSGRRSAADIVSAPGVEIRSPVTGTVKRAGGYVLYCRYADDFLVVEPDEHPGWEVKLLHIDTVAVGPGDRVTAGRTVVARGPTVFPFRSQVDRQTADANWPHVHVEVIDLAIPDVPNGGSGSSC